MKKETNFNYLQDKIDIKTLGKICELRNGQAILNELAKFGYKDTSKDEKLKEISLLDVARAENENLTNEYETHNRKYYATIYRNVKDYENYEFIWVDIAELRLFTEKEKAQMRAKRVFPEYEEEYNGVWIPKNSFLYFKKLKDV